jgi:hypothetical protein
VVNGTMVATSEAAGGGFALGAVVATLGAVIAAPWVATATTADGSALMTVGSAVVVQQPQSRLQESPVEETTHPVRHPRQVRVPSNSSVAPSDTSSVDAVTDDAAIGMVSSTGDDYVVYLTGSTPGRTHADAAGDSLGGLSRSGTSADGRTSRNAMPPFLGHASLDSVTGLVGLDSHDHPWDEQPSVVDLGQVVDELSQD